MVACHVRAEMTNPIIPASCIRAAARQLLMAYLGQRTDLFGRVDGALSVATRAPNRALRWAHRSG